MKPLLAEKITRGEKRAEWVSSEQHLTHDGQVAFMARMQARIKAAQAKPDNVKMITPKTKERA